MRGWRRQTESTPHCHCHYAHRTEPKNNTSKSTSHLLFVPSPHPRYQLPPSGVHRLSIPSRQTQCLAPTGLIQIPSSPSRLRKQRPLRNASFAREQGTEKGTTHHPRRLLLHPARHPALSPFTGSGLVVVLVSSVFPAAPPRPGPARLIDWSTTIGDDLDPPDREPPGRLFPPLPAWYVSAAPRPHPPPRVWFVFSLLLNPL